MKSVSIGFPIIAYNFFLKKKYNKSKEVCVSGLDKFNNHPDGLYILAQCEYKIGNIKSSEMILKTLMESNVLYPQALYLLIKIQKELDRPDNVYDKFKVRYNKFGFLFSSNKTKIISKKKINKKKSPSLVSTDLKPLNISSKLATFTLVNILEQQGLYSQAIQVLNKMGKKGSDMERIELLKSKLKNKLNYQN